jgi:hypothetical protein
VFELEWNAVPIDKKKAFWLFQPHNLFLRNKAFTLPEGFAK